jgi:CHAT domain-containing protein/tetratricopeptide (TPR) repeat protein
MAEHLSSEDIAALIDGTAEEEERFRVVEHLAECGSCREVLAEAARFRELDRPTAAEPRELISRATRARGRRTRRRGWQLALAAVAAVSLWVVIRPRDGSQSDGLGHLRQAAEMLDHRTTTGRLAGFAHRPWMLRRGADDDRIDTAMMRLVGVAGQLVESRRARNDASSRHAIGVAKLVTGKWAAATEDLERAATLAPMDPLLWSDLATALVEKGRHGDPSAFARALAAADRALHLNTTLPEAQFNYAVALRELQLNAAAQTAFARYLQIDASSPWASEAREGIQRLRHPSRTDSWEIARGRFFPISRQRTMDETVVRDVARLYRQETRGLAETELLADWGAAELRSDPETAVVNLDAARVIARALLEASGDRFLHDAIRVIDTVDEADRIRLARAHVIYREARKLQHARRPQLAEPQFEQARSLFIRAHDPMAALTAYWIANCQTDGSDPARPLSLVRSTGREALPAYRNLRGLLAWQEGTILNRFGASAEALAAYGRARELFVDLHEENNAAYMGNAVAAMYANLGREREAWSVRREVFRAASDSGRQELLENVLSTAARTELAKSHDDIAHVLYSLAVAVNTNARLRVDSRIWHALTGARLGWVDEARQDLARARSDVVQIADPRIRESVDNDLRRVSALLTSDPREAIALLTAYLVDAAQRHDAILMPQALVDRARAYRKTGELAAAKIDLEAALAAIERQGASVGPLDLRDSYFASFDEIVRELVDITDQTTGAADALRVNERWRANAVVRNGSPAERDLGSWIRALPANVVVVEYIALSDRLLVLTITRSGITTQHVPIARAELSQLAAKFISSLRRGRVSEQTARALHRSLVEPIGSPLDDRSLLVVVPDPALDAVPFAALQSSDDPRPLIERTTITFAPSLSAYLHARTIATSLPHRPTALIVGNPAFDAETLLLEPLPQAEAEAVDLARLYGVAPVTGEAATKRRVLEALSGADVVQISAHAIADAANPDDSFLVLAPSRDDSGLLSVREIARMQLSSLHLAIVAGCRTAASAVPERQIRNLALAFLAAGASDVIAASWDLDDAVARDFSIDLHRRILGGTSPAIALRDVQRAMLHSSVARLRAPDAWASLRIFGSGL